jgi:predicted DNA-binding transcriptional regulator YafY
MSQIHYLLRNLLIIYKIKSTPYINLHGLIRYVEKELIFRGIHDAGVSRRTILRDIQNIRAYFSVDIIYSHEQQGYYVEESEYTTDIERFLDSFDVLSALNSDMAAPDFVFAEEHRPLGIQHLYPLIRAIKNTLRITFRYRKYRDGALSDRYIEPYAVKECRGRWYVVGRAVGEQDMKTYGLDRMECLGVTEELFRKDKTVDVSEKFKYSYGIYSSDEYPVEEVVLSFDAEDGNYLKSLPLHHSQEVVKDDKDGFVVRLRLKITLDFVMEILSRSWSLKVIEPASLRERVCGIYRSALERNQGSVKD